MYYRFGVSPTASAAIATAYLHDLIKAKYISCDLSYLACDPSKLTRARKKAMKYAIKRDSEKFEKSNILGIFFDGRKDTTRTMEPDSTGRLHHRMTKEEHVTVTVEPSGDYLGHITPDKADHPDKPAKKTAEGVYRLMAQSGADETCQVIGGDSTNSNNGWKGGALAHLEKLLGRKCVWAICKLHTNELPLRYCIYIKL